MVLLKYNKMNDLFKLFALVAILRLSSGCSRDNGEKQDLDKRMTSFAVKTGVQVGFGDHSKSVNFGRLKWVIEFSRPDLFNSNKLLKLIDEETNIYPHKIFKNAGLNQIIFCAQLTFDGERVYGLSDVDEGIIYFDVNIIHEPKNYCIKTIHHELFHTIDDSATDSEWGALNVTNFSYGLKTLQKFNSLVMCDGFISDYATANQSEDKAELFSYYIVAKDYIHKIAQHDDVLNNKVHYLLKFLSKKYPEIIEKWKLDDRQRW